MGESIDWEQDQQVSWPCSAAQLITSTFSPASSGADDTNHLGLLAGGLWTRQWLGLQVSGGLARRHTLLQQRTGPTATHTLPMVPACLSAGTGSMNRLQRKGNCLNRTG